MEKIYNVFVYGTLKRGFPNHNEWMRGARFAGEAITPERLPLYIAGRWRVPYLLNRPGAGFRVHGELFALDKTGLAQLDILESVGRQGGYFRRQIDIDVNCQRVQAWAYLVTDLPLPILQGPLHCYPLSSGYIERSER